MELSNLYTIKDKLTNTGSPVFEKKLHEAAIRDFNSFIRQVPLHIREDYELYFIGHVNHETDELVPLPKKELLCFGINNLYPGEKA